ncbi:hypothetical protein C8J57DRAFT_1480891 [Mycena rebaudengoi]|nr:hypothetical protein C8J57DRAFT_1480891 [Mycena rebaudengoi]
MRMPHTCKLIALTLSLLFPSLQFPSNSCLYCCLEEPTLCGAQRWGHADSIHAFLKYDNQTILLRVATGNEWLARSFSLRNCRAPAAPHVLAKFPPARRSPSRTTIFATQSSPRSPPVPKAPMTVAVQCARAAIEATAHYTAPLCPSPLHPQYNYFMMFWMLHAFISVIAGGEGTRSDVILLTCGACPWVRKLQFAVSLPAECSRINGISRIQLRIPHFARREIHSAYRFDSNFPGIYPTVQRRQRTINAVSTTPLAHHFAAEWHTAAVRRAPSSGVRLARASRIWGEWKREMAQDTRRQGIQGD